MIDKLNGEVTFGRKQSLGVVISLVAACVYFYTNFDNRLAHVERHMVQSREKNEQLERAINEIRISNARIEQALNSLTEYLKRK